MAAEPVARWPCSCPNRANSDGGAVTSGAAKYSGPDRRKQRRWRPRPVRVLLMLLLLSALGYGTAVMWLIGQETRLIFRAGSTLATGRPPEPYEQIAVPRADGVRQFAWAMRAGESDA